MKIESISQDESSFESFKKSVKREIQIIEPKENYSEVPKEVGSEKQSVFTSEHGRSNKLY